MLANKLFPLLAKSEVQEVILLSGKPPCAVVNGSYRRLSAQILQDEDIMTVIAAAHGQDHAAQIARADGAHWDFVLPGVGKVAVSARYDGSNLRMTLKLASLSVQDMPAAAPARPPRPAADGGENIAPVRAHKPAAHSGDSSSAHRAFGLDDSPRAPVQPNLLAEALDLDSLPPAARLRSPQQRKAQDPPPEAFDPTLRDDPDPPPARQAREREAPQRRNLLEASEPLAREARDGFAREAFAMPEEPDAFAEPPPPVQARRSPARPPIDSFDEPSAPLPRAAPAPKPKKRASGKNDAIDVLFDRARTLHASDLHVLADRPATLRIAGELVPQPEVFDPQTLEQLLLPRIPAGVRAVLDREGSCDFALVHPEHGRFRANVGRQRTGLKLTARPISDIVPSLEELGLPTSIANALEHHQGLIVITGPTGHGKTTTMASLVSILNRETSHHVITVEDPIEYVHGTGKAVISQREVGSHTKTFAAALKGSLREDPDVIVVGELRDTETVRMALSASETGHLVISTMNTPSAAKAIERLIDLFPPGDQPQVRMTLAGGLRLIISQRLVPSADRKQLVAACEVLPGSTPLWALIRENRTFQIASLQQRGKSIGIIRLDDSLADLVKAGKTSQEIAREYADSTELLNTLIQGKPQVARPDQQAPENTNDPESLQKRGVELGKQVLSRAGKLFGGENK